jgi:cation diffusion facilitator family transporter
VQVSWREMRAVVAAFTANLGIAVIKFVAFLLTGSASMLAESVHSVADTGNELLLIVGRGRSRRPASDEHPFGYGRERYFYGFVVSVMLFTVGAAFSVYDGLHKVLNPDAVRSPAIAFGVLALSAVLEGFSLRTAIREANESRGDRSWATFIRRSKAPELPVVLLEDLAALIGLVFAFAGVALSVLTGDGRWDGVGSLAIGVLLATAAAILAIEMKSLLIGESASPEVQRMIIAALEDGPELAQVIHLRTVHISPDALLVAAKVAIRENDSASQITLGIDTAERRVRAAVPIATTIYLEPDIYRPQKPDQTDPSIRAILASHTSHTPHPSRRTRRTRPMAPEHPITTEHPRYPANPKNPSDFKTPPAPETPGPLSAPETPGPLSAPETPSTPAPRSQRNPHSPALPAGNCPPHPHPHPHQQPHLTQRSQNIVADLRRAAPVTRDP